MEKEIVKKTGNHTKPVVVIFGWMGSQQRQIQKYLSIYPDHTSISVTMSAMEMFYQTNKIKERGEEVNQMLQTELGERVKLKDASLQVVVHAFSNGGGSLFLSMIRHAQLQEKLRAEGSVAVGEEILDRISLVVWDSAPGRLFGMLSSFFVDTV